jgi:hypothetical protein
MEIRAKYDVDTPEGLLAAEEPFRARALRGARQVLMVRGAGRSYRFLYDVAAQDRLTPLRSRIVEIDLTTQCVTIEGWEERPSFVLQGTEASLFRFAEGVQLIGKSSSGVAFWEATGIPKEGWQAELLGAPEDEIAKWKFAPREWAKSMFADEKAKPSSPQVADVPPLARLGVAARNVEPTETALYALSSNVVPEESNVWKVERSVTMKASDEMLPAFRTRSVFALFHRIREHHEEAASDVILMQFDNVEVILRRRSSHSHCYRFTRVDTLTILRISCSASATGRPSWNAACAHLHTPKIPPAVNRA